MTDRFPTDHNRQHFGAVSSSPARYQGQSNHSLYLTMRDGVRLAVDVYLPANLPAGERLPTLLAQTRYWRQSELRAPFKWFLAPEDLNPPFRGFKPFFTDRGYALVYVDVRGTGASFGHWPYPWDAASIEDTGEVVDWIIAQPWSNGRVGAHGVSFLGTTAELSAAISHPAVRAIVPRFNHPDPYRDIGMPGGLSNARFVQAWSEMDDTLDRNQIPPLMGRLAQLLIKGVKPVQGDRAALAAAIADHAGNNNTSQLMEQIICADELSAIGISAQDMCVDRYRDVLAQTEAAFFGWASWMDAGTADAALRRFLTYDSAQRLVIGAWEHGGQFQASPYQPSDLPADPPLESQWAELIHFFDAYLKDADNGARDQRLIHYYTLGAERWQSADQWPPPGARPQRYYLAEDRKLALTAPEETAADRYVVDFSATTGLHNRWWELSGAFKETVVYEDRVRQDGKVLAYTSPPLEREVEISGYPVVHLYLTSTEPDGAVFVYLEDVDPAGRVTYITEGQLRLIHRRLSEGQGRYAELVPYRTFSLADRMPVPPGEVVEVIFALLPTSVLIRRGHCLRISLAGHDAGTFPRLPESGTPVYELQRGGRYASFVDLPTLA